MDQLTKWNQNKLMKTLIIALLFAGAGYFAGSALPSPLMRMSYYELEITNPDMFEHAKNSDPRWYDDWEAFLHSPEDNTNDTKLNLRSTYSVAI